MKLTIDQINTIMENSFQVSSEFSLMEITALLIENNNSFYCKPP